MELRLNVTLEVLLFALNLDAQVTSRVESHEKDP
jgi:hypothetical protein